MEDDFHKPGLYRWKTQMKPRLYSRTQKVTSTDDIQQWMQKVEAASDRAVKVVLGTGEPAPYSTAGRGRHLQVVRDTSEQAKIQNEAYQEAEELLQQWMSEKAILSEDGDNLGTEMDVDDPWRRQELGSKARREWDKMLNGNFEELGEMGLTPKGKGKISGSDPYANLYDMEEKEAVSMVVKAMLEKEVVKADFRKDLGFDSNEKLNDPRSKMELRHQRVRENREKRERELEKRKKETETKKQAQLAARQMVMKEEKDRCVQAKQEELEIRRQMSIIRKEMADQHKAQLAEKTRQQREQEQLARQAQAELERQQALERQEMLEKQRKENEHKLVELAQQELATVKQAALRLKVLQRHFSAWYNLVIQRRLQFGKARALADWRLMLRVWTAWRSLVRFQRVAMETQQYQKNVVEENRKMLIAMRHFETTMLRQCFTAWRQWVSDLQDQRALHKAQQETRSKMLNLLKAVADGALESVHSDTPDRAVVDKKEARSGQSTSRTVREKERRPHSAVSSRPEVTSPTSCTLRSASTTSVSSQGVDMPREAWQVTRKHLKLTKEEIKNLTRDPTSEQQDGEIAEYDDLKIRRRFGTQLWMNKRYVVNNFEHRFTAQQKLLHTQQAEIREQRRLLQELMSAQHLQALQNDLSEQQEAQAGTDRCLGRDDTPARQPKDSRNERSMAAGEVVGRQKTMAKGFISPQSSSPDNSARRELSTPSTHQHVTDGGDTYRSEVPTPRTNCSDSTVAQNHNSKYLQVMENMDKRAKERARLKAERDEKRRRMEEERLERLKQEEEEKKRKEEEEKRARVLAYKEKKRLEKQKEQERQNELQRQAELCTKADEHYRKALMKFRVLLPMKRLVEMAWEKVKMADRHHNLHVLRLALTAWKAITDEVTAEKKRAADKLHGHLIVLRCFKSWKNFKYRAVFLEHRADRFYNDLILPKMFNAWRQFSAEEKERDKQQMQKTEEFFPLSLKRKVFRAWRRLPKELQREAEREKLRAEMRRKVANLLPDFQPVLSVDQSTDSQQ